MTHYQQTWGKSRGAVVRSDSLDVDVRCRITIKAKRSMDIIASQEVLGITIHQLLQVYKDDDLRNRLVTELSNFGCVLNDLPKLPNRLISATVDGKRPKKLRDDIVQLLNSFSGYCEECNVSQDTIKILKYSDLLFTEIRNRGNGVDIVYYKDDLMELLVDVSSCSEEQKWCTMSSLGDGDYTPDGKRIRISTNPQNVDRILEICYYFDISVKNKDGYAVVYRGTDIGNGKDRLYNNKSQWQSTLSSNTEREGRYVNNNSQWQSSSEDRRGCNNSQWQSTSSSNAEQENKHVHDNSQWQASSNSNTEPGNRYGHYNSQWHSPSSSNTEPGDMTIRDKTNVRSTNLLEASGGAGSGSVHDDVRLVNDSRIGSDKDLQHGDNSWVFVNRGNGQDAECGGTHKEDKGRLPLTSQDTVNDMNTDRYDLKQIDLIYLKLFAKRKQIQDNILHCFSQSGYNPCFKDDGSIEPPLNNQEFFVLNVVINQVLDIKKVLITQYDIPDGWVDSMNIIENDIVVEEREPHILIVGLKDTVARVLVNLCKYKRKAGVSTKGCQPVETNQVSGGMGYGINSPVDCEYICNAGDQLLYGLQKRYQCLIDIQPLVTGTKDIYIANWSYYSNEVGLVEIPLVIGNYRELPQQTDMLVLTQNQTDQCNESRQKIGDHLTLLKNNEGHAHHVILQNIVSSKVKMRQDLEELVRKGGYKTLILLMDKTTEKETVSFYLSACKNQTKKIYLPMESRPGIKIECLRNLFQRGKLEYGGQGHYIEMKIGHINDQKVGVIVDAVQNQTQSDTYTIKETKAKVGVHQYRFELNIPPYIYDASNPMIDTDTFEMFTNKKLEKIQLDSNLSIPFQNLSFLVMKCLIEANKKKMTSIAFPVLGVGSSGYPVELVARSMLETIDEYFRCQNETSLCQVMIVIEDGDTRSKKAFFRENLARIKEGRMTGDTVYKVDIEITGDERDKWRIKKEIDDIIVKKEVFFNDISNPIREVRVAAGRVDEVNKKLSGDKIERPTTERDLERSSKMARVRPMIEREKPTTERKDKGKNCDRKAPVVDKDTSRTNGEGKMDVILKHALANRDETHESRCVIIQFSVRDIGISDIKNILIPNLNKKENKSLCVVSPYQGDIYRAFLSFGSKRVKDEACSVIKRIYRNSKFIDIPQEVVIPLINRVNIHIKDCNDLKQDLVEASGVSTISNNGEVFIEGCPQQIELAKTMLETKYSLKRRNQNIESIPEHLEPHSVKTYKFRALEYLFGKDKMIKICCDVKEADGETHFTLPKDSKNKLVEDLKDLMYRTIRHEEIDVTGDKIEEAKRYSRNHAHMDTVYVEFNIKTSSIHVLGEDYVEVELVSHQAKLAVGIIKLTNKKQQRTRTDEYTPTPTVKLPPAEIQERIFHTKCKNLTVHVMKSDITILDVDVIVNAANGMMMHGGGVARFIAIAGGDELDRQCRRYIHDNGQLPVTGICKTTGGNMRCKQVYHAVGPSWFNYSNKSDCEDDLCKTIIRCLVEADQDGFQSIAIPSISSAIFGVPKNICAHMYAKAVKSFDAVHHVSNLREIYFVDVLDGMVSMVQTGFDMFFTQGNDNDDLIKEEIERFIKEITCKGAEHQSEVEITDNKPPEFSMIAVTKEVDNKPYITCSLQSIITLHIYQASALSTSTESVTTWEDTKMTDLRASAKKIINEAGDKYKEERSKVKTDGGFKTGTVLSTSAGESLPYKHIYHLISSIKPGPKEVDILMANLIKEISLTTDASVTIDVGNIDAGVLFTSLVDLFKTANSSTLKEIHLVAESEDKIKKLHSNYGDYIKQLGGIMKTSDINCPICLEEMSDFKTLPCGHTFCAKCVDKAIETNPTCPSCRSSAYGEIQTGNQPDGKMEHNILHTSLQGFPHCDTIEIMYSFNDGIQSANHQRPGYPFKGRTETAYLPDNMEGREILKLLKLAFDKRLIFTVSPGVTSSSGKEFVTWNNIPHKTRQDGGPESNGYPDPDYLPQVRKALHTRGVIIQNRSN